ncbi:MAG: hypothetical protein ABH875_02950 [Candidatus Omnitrophota bacterium]
MTVKSMVSNLRGSKEDFVFIRMDTLIERLRRMRALNSSPSDIGLTQYTWRSCDAVRSITKRKNR